MLNARAQVATEYLVITGFMLAFVTVIFGYCYVNYDQSIKTSQVSDLLDSLVNKADYVYALGPQNTQFTEAVIPRNVVVIRVVNMCNDGTQLQCTPEAMGNGTGSETGCDCVSQTPDHGGIKRSALEAVVYLIGGPTVISRVAKTAIVLEDDAEGKPFPCIAAPDKEFWDGRFRIKVYWPQGEEKVFLQKV